MVKPSIKVSTHIGVPIDRVWQAITDPRIVEKYFFGTKLETSWEIGSPIFFRGEWNGQPYEDKGSVVKFDPEKMYQFTYWSSFSGLADMPENYNLVTYELDREGAGTKVTITQENIRDKKAAEDSEKNWKQVLEALKKMLEEGGSPAI